MSRPAQDCGDQPRFAPDSRASSAPLTALIERIQNIADKKLKVVIVGAGMAAWSAAKVLRNAPVDVLLIDLTNDHLFQPLLDEAQVIAAQRALARDDFVFALGHRHDMSFAEYVASLEDRRHGRGLPEGWVPDTFLVAEAGCTSSFQDNAVPRKMLQLSASLLYAERTMSASTKLYDIPVHRLNGEPATLAEYAGKVLLIVNTASACGLTPQYTGLEALHRKYGERGFAVLGFPCNQFGGQEPGDAEQIATFCSTRYDVSFPLFAKIDVNGPKTHPLYAALKSAQPRPDDAGDIQWNFAKFLVGRDGEVRARFDPRTPPEQLVPEIERALG